MRPELQQRAARCGLRRIDDAGWRRDGQERRLLWKVGAMSGNNWCWRPESEPNDLEPLPMYRSEEAALTAALDWLDQQERAAQAEPEAPNPALLRGPADDVLEVHPEHAEAAVGRWLHAHPDTLWKALETTKLAGPWEDRHRYDRPERAGQTRYWLGAVWKDERGWTYRAKGQVHRAATEREAMAKVDAELLSLDYALVGGAVLAPPAQTQPSEQPAPPATPRPRRNCSRCGGTGRFFTGRFDGVGAVHVDCLSCDGTGTVADSPATYSKATP